jgi:hypothetical protein
VAVVVVVMKVEALAVVAELVEDRTKTAQMEQMELVKVAVVELQLLVDMVVAEATLQVKREVAFRADAVVMVPMLLVELTAVVLVVVATAAVVVAEAASSAVAEVDKLHRAQVVAVVEADSLTLHTAL